MATIDAQGCYWGRTRATITVGQLQSRIFQEPQKIAAAASMQAAFDLYFHAYQAANDFGSDRFYDKRTTDFARQAIRDVREKMQKDLRAAADTGYIQYKLGGHLKWAFEHLQSTGGVWRDDGFNGWNGLTMPSAIVNFLENVEKRGTEVVASYNQWQTTQMRIKEQARNARWDSLGTEIGYAQTAFENITPKIWCWLGGKEAGGSRAASIGGKWLGYGASLHSYTSLYLKIRYNKDGAKEAALAEAAAYVVEKLPIFGSLYGEVIRGIPGLVSWFKAYAKEQERYINIAGGR
jgi:hypothetical protein